MPTESLITLVCALPSEARPLLEHYRLAQVNEKPFRVFANAALSLRLVVSGIGVEACATAVGFCAGLQTNRPSDIWVNIGVAGHRDLDIGSVALGARIQRDGASKNWYPGFLFDTHIPVSEVVSFNEPVQDYPAGTLCDMEAAGFMAAASRVGNTDLIQVCKIVSDNASNSLANINREFVTRLVQQQIPAIETLLSALRGCSEAAADFDDDTARSIASQWHFSQTQRLRLSRDLRRVATLDSEQRWTPAALDKCRSGREVLSQLENEIARLSPQFAP